MKYRLIFLISLFLSVSIYAETNLVTERRAYWETVVATEIPVGSSIANLNKWAQQRSLKIVSSSNSLLLINLESISTTNSVCKGFSISLEIKVGEDNNIRKETVQSLGNCL